VCKQKGFIDRACHFAAVRWPFMDPRFLGGARREAPVVIQNKRIDPLAAAGLSGRIDRIRSFTVFLKRMSDYLLIRYYRE
jgi:hypothetical protein